MANSNSKQAKLVEQFEGVDEIVLLDEKENSSKNVEINIPEINKMKKETSYKKNKHTIAVYPYKNEKGILQYEILRRTGRGEKFLVRSIDENGEEIYRLPDNMDLVPYNLQEVRRAIEENKIIWIMEGESKVDTMTKLDFISTTCAFSGPNKWAHFYNDYLEGAKVIIVVADNDLNGEKFAEHTTESLLEDLDNVIVSIIRINEICPFIKHGGDIDDLLDLVGEDTVKATLKTIESNFFNEEVEEERR